MPMYFGLAYICTTQLDGNDLSILTQRGSLDFFAVPLELPARFRKTRSRPKCTPGLGTTGTLGVTELRMKDSGR